jgi:peptidyl-dipeptidase Dcp
MNTRTTLAVAVALGLTLTACSQGDGDNGATEAETAEAAPVAPAAMSEPAASNPFFVESPLYLKHPQFDLIDDEHYLPAFERGMEEHLTEIEAIANDPEPATFENTLVAMERSGQLLDRVSRVFYAMASAHTNDTIEEVRSEMAPRLAAHGDAILLNDALFARVKAIHDARDNLELDAESYRLVEETYRDFVRAGAPLSADEKEQLKAYNAELASLQTQFSQNVLGEVNAKAIVVDDPARLDGLGEAGIASAAEAARARDLEGQYVIPLLNTSGQPALSSLTDRALRQRIMETSLGRGSSGGEFDNREVLTRVAKIRAERAALLGYPNHAAYSLENQTAGTVDAVNERLGSLAPAAVANARKEAEELQAMIDAEGGDF